MDSDLSRAKTLIETLLPTFRMFSYRLQYCQVWQATFETAKWKAGLSRGYACKVKPSSPIGCNDSDTIKPKLFAWMA